MATETKTVSDLTLAASALELPETRLQELLIQEYATIEADPIEAPRYPQSQEAFVSFAVETMSRMEPASLDILRKLMHRDELRKFYYHPNELEAISKILAVIEDGSGHDLILDRAGLYSLPPLLLKTRGIKFIDISHNLLRDLSLLMLMPGLEMVQASHNQLQDVACLSGARSLQAIDLSYNAVTGSLEPLHSIPNLRSIDLRGNKLNDVQVKSVLGLLNLEVINLKENYIDAPEDILDKVDKLRDYFGLTTANAEPVQSQAPGAKGANDDPLKDPIYLSYAIRDIRLKGNPDKVLLDIEKLAPIFYELISNSDKNGEHFFGLFGRWGRGKTFFWKYLLKNNLNKDKYIPIEFHAWKYQDTPGVWAYLYNTLNDAYMGDKPKWYQLGKWVTWVRKLLRLNDHRGKTLAVVIFLLTIIAAVITYFVNAGGQEDVVLKNTLRVGIPVSVASLFIYVARNFKTDARKIITSLTSNVNFNSHLGFQHEIQQELKHLFKAWIPEKDKFQKRIFLFIDDIDRCSEDKIIQIVDYIRVLLHCETIQDRITVLAAIDERILLHAIQAKYKQFIENKGNDATYKELCREYMDKLFLAGLKLGPLTEYEKRQIVEGFTDEDTAAEAVRTPVKGGIDSNRVANLINQTDQEGVVHAPQQASSVENKIEIPEEVQKTVKVTPDTIPSTARKEFPYEKWEQEFIKDILARNTESTPRSIRVYTYRYLLGKQLVEKALREGKASWKQWYNTKEAKQCFAIKLLHYGFKSDTDHLMADYKSFITNYDEHHSVNENVYGYEIALNQELGSIMYQVLTMIIAY